MFAASCLFLMLPTSTSSLVGALLNLMIAGTNGRHAAPEVPLGEGKHD